MAASGALIGASIGLQALGAVNAYNTSRQAARARKAAAEFEAQQLEQNASQSIAAAQRQAFETGRTGEYVQSRAQALAAASGGSATDPTVINVIANLASETGYRKSLDLYQGEERARQLRLSAQAARMTGEIGAQANIAQGNAAVIQAGANVGSDLARGYRPSAVTMYERYSRGIDFSEADRQAAAGYN